MVVQDMSGQRVDRIASGDGRRATRVEGGQRHDKVRVEGEKTGARRSPDDDRSKSVHQRRGRLSASTEITSAHIHGAQRLLKTI